MRCKSIVVPLDAQSTKKEIEYVINDCRPDIVFISDDKKATDAILSAAKKAFIQAVEQARQSGLDEETLKNIIDTTFKGGNPDD